MTTAIDRTLPQKAVEEDHRLEASAGKAGERLAKHRWHWTLDEANAGRVSMKQYARSVGRAFSTIQAQVSGYAAWLEAGATAGPRSLNEQLERAKVGAEKEATIEAVAGARGLSFQQVRKTRPTEVKRVREAARDAAERKGTSVADEVETVAQFIVKTEQADQRVKDEREGRLGLGYINVEGKIIAALRALRDAVQMAADFKFGEEEQELLRHSLDQVRQAADLIDKRIAGIGGVDWDAELASIMEATDALR